MVESRSCWSADHHQTEQREGGLFAFRHCIEANYAATSAAIRCHTSCGASYTSNEHKGRETTKKRRNDAAENEPPVRRRRSQLPGFDFKCHCLLCGEECLAMDERHPNRWDKVRQCETDVRPGRLTFKQQFLDIGEGRGDAWANDVALRVAGVTDLPAADAQHHQRCYTAYRKHLLTPADCAPVISNTALSSVIVEMDCNWKQTWTVADLYKLYQEYDGQLSSKHMISNLSHYHGEQLMILRLEGCANVIGFRRFFFYQGA